MENNNELIVEGMIIHGPGGCPECGSPIWVADSELTLMELNMDGIPISEDTTIQCRGVCSHCGRKINMVRWKGGYIPYTPTSLMLKELEARDEFNDRVKETNRIAEKRLGSNPFAIEE